MTTPKILRETVDPIQRFIPAKETAMLCPKCGAEMTEQTDQYDIYDCPDCEQAWEIKPA